MACLLHGGSGGMAAPSLWPGVSARGAGGGAAALGGGLDSGGEGAAVDGQQRAVDEGRFVRGEECHGVRDLLGAADATQGVMATKADRSSPSPAWTPSVSMMPGTTALTRTPEGPYSLAQVLVSWQRRRQTSFAEVGCCLSPRPPITSTFPRADVRVDVYRSSGPGGQSVNTTDSAVRLTHIPTGIVVTCQNEKSQLQNKVSAMRVLQAKLLERKRLEERAELDALKGDGGSSWGNQMRSYVLHPYQMVKDLRTDYEVGNPAAVLDGDIDGFLEAGIRWRNRRDDE